jgi:LuxR family maltose regulon positive regulatory protein
MDLRFTASEAAEFLNQVMGLALSPEDVAALEARTEGWIAGLQLAALALQGPLSMQGRGDASELVRAFTGSHRYVLDYLIEEVLEQQPPSVQSFLLQTAVLDRLTGTLCDALTGQDDGQDTLETLERANMFIVPLDEERRWYRYHHLFAELLHQRLHKTQPEQDAALHVRASVWYEENGLTDQAVAHALRAEDFERAVDLIEELADTLWGRGESTKLRDWLLKLPVALLFSRPHLCVYHAWHLFLSGQFEMAEQTIEAVEQMLDSNPARTNEAKNYRVE